MNEIEVKILEIDPKGIVAKLKKLGAKKVEAGILHATALDYPDDRLRKKGGFVRVRKFSDRTELTVKMPISQERVKSMEEIETTVGDYEATCRIFEHIGMKSFMSGEKYRATYKLRNIKFEIDKYPGMPWIMEVEAGSEKEVEEGVNLLGFKMKETTPEGTRKIFEKYGLSNFFTFKEKGESPDYDSLFR